MAFTPEQKIKNFNFGAEKDYMLQPTDDFIQASVFACCTQIRARQ